MPPSHDYLDVKIHGRELALPCLSCPTARRLPQGTPSVRQMRTPSTVTLGAWRRQVVTSRRRASGVVVGDGRYRQVDRRPRPRKGPTWVNLTKACVERLSSMWT